MKEKKKEIEIIKKERVREKNIKYLYIDAQCFSTFGEALRSNAKCI
jgi:hypothetical protein